MFRPFFVNTVHITEAVAVGCHLFFLSCFLASQVVSSVPVFFCSFFSLEESFFRKKVDSLFCILFWPWPNLEAHSLPICVLIIAIDLD